MRDGENVRAVEALGINWLGFIFWKPSSRYVSRQPSYLPSKARRVGVFVDEDVEQVKRIARDYALDIIQLHGSETPDYALQLSDWVIIKAFRIATVADFEQAKVFEGVADYFLFDTKAQRPGGNGLKFDWDVLGAYNGHVPFLLSGGIGSDDVERLHHFYHPMCVGIDLNSRFESEPAVKDVEALSRFLSHLLI